MTYSLSIIRLPRLTGEPLFFTDRLPCGGVQVRLGPFMVLREQTNPLCLSALSKA